MLKSSIKQSASYSSTLVSSIVKKFIPDAFIFAVLLTFIVFLSGVIFEGKTVFEMSKFWGDSFFNLLKFSAQMALVLVFGFVLARTTLVNNLLNQVIKYANTQTQGVILVSIVSIICCFINWGFGLIVSAIIAKKIFQSLKDKNIKTSFGVLISSAYSGFLVWHGGISGSIPLKIAGSDKILKSLNLESVSIENSLFSSFNLSILIAVIFTVLIINFIVSLNTDENSTQINEQVQSNIIDSIESTPAIKLENSKILKWIFVGFTSLYLFSYFSNNGGFNLNIMILIFFVLGITLSQNLSSYIEEFKNSIAGSAGILLQFPLYAGIMGMMSQSGLAANLSEFFIEISTKETFLLNTYLSAGIVNFFVPSGGGQWVVQGPIILPAALELGVDTTKAAMAIAWGDAWTNMIQPFWALPLLSVAGLKLKDIMGHCILLFLSVGLVTGIILVL